MGGMTDRTPFRLDRGVLENPRTPLFGVTIKADIVIELYSIFSGWPWFGSREACDNRCTSRHPG